ncbi:CCA tRNA nucleotidyltransferase, partial [Cohnella lubricantis]
MPANSDRAWQAGLAVVRVLEEAGHAAYLVGGCVRDRLLGRPLNDIDIACSARPEEVMSMFARVVPTGLQHGTVTVVENGMTFEVTTFRQEAGYSDSRHPDAVLFVKDIREDLARRDFTINAMAIGPAGTLVDPFGGAEDLKRGVVRCVGDALERFAEDALRMVRAVRFAAEFAFEIDAATWDGLLRRREGLRHVAMERIGAELDKMVCGSGPDRAVELLQASGLLAQVREPPERLPPP